MVDHMSAFFDLADRIQAKADRNKDALKAELEAKIEQQRQEIKQLRAELAARPQLALKTIDEDQFAQLQSRLQSMHEAKLLTDDELFGLEDQMVDCLEAMPTASLTVLSASQVENVAKMLMVASKVANDAMLARQLRRKFL